MSDTKKSQTLSIGEVMERRLVVHEQLLKIARFQGRKIVDVCSSRGTAEEWKDMWDINFGGAGEYVIGPDEVLVIIKDGKRSPPNDFEEGKAHKSVRRYYGAVFFGCFYKFARINNGLL